MNEETGGQEQFVMVGDMGTDYAWIVDWKKYRSIPWYRRIFSRNACIVTGGSRNTMRILATQLNAGNISTEEAKRHAAYS